MSAGWNRSVTHGGSGCGLGDVVAGDRSDICRSWRRDGRCSNNWTECHHGRSSQLVLIGRAWFQRDILSAVAGIDCGGCDWSVTSHRDASPATSISGVRHVTRRAGDWRGLDDGHGLDDRSSRVGLYGRSDLIGLRLDAISRCGTWVLIRNRRSTRVLIGRWRGRRGGYRTLIG